MTVSTTCLAPVVGDGGQRAHVVVLQAALQLLQGGAVRRMQRRKGVKEGARKEGIEPDTMGTAPPSRAAPTYTPGSTPLTWASCACSLRRW